jgi:NADH-quinone oxidoreductase subunit C
MVEAERLIAVATYMRDTLGYAYLSDIVVVDYLDAGLFELVYLFYHPAGGPHLSVRVRVPRDAPRVPALTPIWPGANFIEREAYDLFGINFLGHPYLKRIYLWDEFEGYPMRKDFPKQGDKYLEEK